MSDTQEKIVQNLKRLIKSKTDKIEKLSSERRHLIECLQTECPHDKVKDEESYHSGDYYNYSYTDHRHVCETCGKTLKKYREQHSWR